MTPVNATDIGCVRHCLIRHLRSDRGHGGTATACATRETRYVKPAPDSISVEHNFMEVCVLARLLAELAAPPTMRHHAETSATMNADLRLADLGLSHHTLAQR